jgi:HK97 gp10 family phage protein
MGWNAKVTINGGGQIANVLKKLPDEFIKKDVMRVQRVQMKPILAAVKEATPVDFGLLAEDMIMSCRMRDGNVVGRIGILVITGKQRERLRAKYASLGTMGQLYDAYYGVFVEFGTKFQKPQRFMTRVFDDHAKIFADDFAEALWPELNSRVESLKGANS